MPVAPSASDDDLIEDAWRVLRELTETGRATLKNGAVINAADPLVSVIQHIAKLKRPPERRMAVLDGHRVRATRKTA